MKIELINYGLLIGHEPKRAHTYDVGADVYSQHSLSLQAGETLKMPLGFGIKLPPGYAGYIFPRSELSAKGIVCQLPPIDPGYTGEVHAVVTNLTDEEYKVTRGDRIGQLVILPCIHADYVWSVDDNRESGAFGSTGR